MIRGTGAAEPTDFLYPFIEGDERDATSLLRDLASSARAKIEASTRIRRDSCARAEVVLDTAARAMARAFSAGGRLFTFGNGGSATDARLAAERFLRPAHGRPLPAMCLAEDRAVLTALANDVGFELVFDRQLRAHGGAGDIALGLSTSGGSVNVLRAFATAHDLGMETVGLAGYEGGSMVGNETVTHCIVVEGDSIHRIQEAQDSLVGALWTRVQLHLGRDGGA